MRRAWAAIVRDYIAVTDHWRHHPGVRSHADLPLGDRAADRLRNSMGSWLFVFAALGFLGLWMVSNSSGGPDPYPYILLNLMLSCLAALQGAILLIAAKRSDAISAELAQHDYQINQDTKSLVEQQAQILAEMRADHAALLVEVRALRSPTAGGGG